MLGYLRFLAAPVLVVALGSACRPVNTVPEPVSPADPIQHYALEIPAALEVRSVDFDVALFSDVSGGPDLTSSQVGGRGFLKVYAVHKQTGEQYLLIYENIRERKRPVQVIRFLSVPDDSLLAPPRAP